MLLKPLTCASVCSYLVVLILKLTGVKAKDEFKQYSLASLDCPYSLQMSIDWLYSGQVTMDSDQPCNITIHADYTNEYKLMFYFGATGGGPALDSLPYTQLQAYDGSKVETGRFIAGIDNDTFSSPEPRVFTTSQNALTIEYSYSLTDMPNTSYTVTFTAYREGLCDSYEYRCANTRCIFHSLSCREHNPCGDNSDCQISYPAITALALCGFCSLGVLILLCYIIVQNTKDRFGDELRRQPRKFSPSKAFGSFKSFTPATVTFTPLHRKWSTA